MECLGSDNQIKLAIEKWNGFRRRLHELDFPMRGGVPLHFARRVDAYY